MVCTWQGWIYDFSTCEKVNSGEGGRGCLARLSVVDRGEEVSVLQAMEAEES